MSVSYRLLKEGAGTARLMWFSLVGVGLILGSFYRMGWVFALAGSAYLVLAYLRARSLAENLYVRRKAPALARERDWIEIHYEIINASPFSLTPFIGFDNFTGSRNHQINIASEHSAVPGRTRAVVVQRLPCNAGMGKHSFGPLRITLSDPLGLFEFQWMDDETSETSILPKLEPLIEFPLQGSPDSFLYGKYEILAKGNSANFTGIREYHPGDPPRQIAWKLSAKKSELLVKEFERIVNTDVTLALLMDPREHFGKQAESTWETAKDLALSLVSQQNAASNRFQLITEKTWVPFGQGEDHAHFLMTRLFSVFPEILLGGTYLKTTPAPDGNLETRLLRKYRSEIPRTGNVILITPVLRGDSARQALEDLTVLKGDGIQVHVILLDPTPFETQAIPGVHRIGAESALIEAKRHLNNLIEWTQLRDIPVHVVPIARASKSQLEFAQ